MNRAEDLAVKTINLLEVKLTEIKNMFRCNLTYDEKKKLDRIKVAIEHSLESLRRAKMDNGIPKIMRR